MTTLQELAREEDAIASHVASLDGPMEHKHEVLAVDGTFKRYAVVFANYAERWTGTAGSAEAFKRALFLHWYSIVEPPCFTGLCDLDGDAVHKVLENLHTHLALAAPHNPDPELLWMLPWYNFIADHAFATATDFVRNFLAAHRSAKLPRPPLARPALECRGLMGRYWISVLRL